MRKQGQHATHGPGFAWGVIKKWVRGNNILPGARKKKGPLSNELAQEQGWAFILTRMNGFRQAALATRGSRTFLPVIIKNVQFAIDTFIEAENDHYCTKNNKSDELYFFVHNWQYVYGYKELSIYLSYLPVKTITCLNWAKRCMNCIKYTLKAPKSLGAFAADEKNYDRLF